MANDSFGNLNQKSAGFNVQIGAPSISLIDPVDSYFNITQNLDFVYTASDIDLEACELWGNFTGGWGLSQSNASVVSGIESHFFMNLSEGDYLWNIRCNDSIGNSAFASNESFYVDTTIPSLTLSAPSGAYNSRLNIPLAYNASDASPLSCYYNVYRGAVLEAPSTSVNCYAGSSFFSVTLDADFTINFYAEDPIGHLTNSSSSFTVDTSAPPSGGSDGGGSSGGSSGGGGIISKKSIDAGSISDIVISQGGVKKVSSWKVKNNGTVFLNDCLFRSQGEYASWVPKTEAKGLAAGEEYVFVFDVNIPENLEVGEYPLEILLKCSELNETAMLFVEVTGKQIDFRLINVERLEEGSVSVKYTMKELVGKSHEVELQFLIFDLDNKKEAEVNEAKQISAGSEREFETIIPIREELEGELSLLVNLNSETYSAFVQENIVLGSRRATGLAIFGDEGAKDSFVSGLIIVLFIAFAFFIFRRIRKHKAVIRHKHFINRHDFNSH